MIKAVLFDLGGTLHKSSSPPGRDLWFAQRLIERFSDYGIKLEGGAELLAGCRCERNEKPALHSECF